MEDRENELIITGIWTLWNNHKNKTKSNLKNILWINSIKDLYPKYSENHDFFDNFWIRLHDHYTNLRWNEQLIYLFMFIKSCQFLNNINISCYIEELLYYIFQFIRFGLQENATNTINFIISKSSTWEYCLTTEQKKFLLFSVIRLWKYQLVTHICSEILQIDQIDTEIIACLYKDKYIRNSLNFYITDTKWTSKTLDLIELAKLYSWKYIKSEWQIKRFFWLHWFLWDHYMDIWNYYDAISNYEKALEYWDTSIRSQLAHLYIETWDTNKAKKQYILWFFNDENISFATNLSDYYEETWNKRLQQSWLIIAYNKKLPWSDLALYEFYRENFDWFDDLMFIEAVKLLKQIIKFSDYKITKKDDIIISQLIYNYESAVRNNDLIIMIDSLRNLALDFQLTKYFETYWNTLLEITNNIINQKLESEIIIKFLRHSVWFKKTIYKYDLNWESITKGIKQFIHHELNIFNNLEWSKTSKKCYSIIWNIFLLLKDEQLAKNMFWESWWTKHVLDFWGFIN